MGLLIVALTWAGANQVGMWTYMILWWMRLSAKFNIFLGVPNHSAEFLPQQIAYLESYFKKQSMNLLFPVSVTVATAATVLLLVAAGRADAGSFEQVSLTLLGALCALALLEHWFFVLPIDVTKLWGWGFASRDGGPAAGETDDERPRWDRDKVGSAEKVVYRAGAV
jgi:putative photosynthetic complex assembly protein 2